MRVRRNAHFLRRSVVESLEDRRLFSGEPWGAFPQLTDQDLAVQNYSALTGAGTSVAVIDTGIDYNHPALGGGFGAGHKVVAGWDFVDNDADPFDPVGHGTGVAGVIAANTFVYNGAKYQGIAPGANLIALRADDGGEVMDVAAYEAALQWVISHRVEYNIVAVNISNGYGHYSTDTPVGQLADELSSLAAAGVFIAASSGNDGAFTPYGVEYPAADPNVYAIGSINVSDVISTFTERGANMDLLAPGEDVPLIYYNPGTGQHIYLTGSGTSFASPHAVGAAALLKQLDPTLTAAQIMTLLHDSGASNYDGDAEALPNTHLTFRRLDLDGALALAYSQLDDDSEENDTKATATAIPIANNEGGLDNLTLLAADADFYRFTLSQNAGVDFYFGTDGGGTLPAPELRDSNGDLIDTLSLTDWMNLPAGTYYLKLSAASTMPGTYWLYLAITPDDIYENNDSTGTATTLTFSGGDVSLDGLQLAANDDDYFRFTLGASASLAFGFWRSVAGDEPPIQLLNNSNNVLTYLSNGDVTMLSAGTYYLRMMGSASPLAGEYGFSLSQVVDDGHEDNDTTVTATPVAFSGSTAALSSLVLLGGDDDCYSFALTELSDVSVTLNYSPASKPQAELLNASGTLLGSFAAATLSKRLSAGTYYLRLRSSQTLPDTYGFTITRANVAMGADGAASDMAYDSAGKLHFAWYDTYARDLKYAVRSAAGVWSAVQIIDATAGAGQNLSLAIDAKGNPGIAYYDPAHGDLRYAYYNRITWSIRTIDSTGTTGRLPSLAYDVNGRPAIAFWDSTLSDLRFASWNGSTWKKSTIEHTGRYSSLVYNRSKNVFAIAYERTNGGLYRYAEQTSLGGAWSFVTVDDTVSGGGYVSLAFDRNYRPAFSYYDAKYADLKFARFNGSIWRVATVASTGTQGMFSNLAFSADGKADILYYNKSANAVFCAHGDIGSWSVAQMLAGGGSELSAGPERGGHREYACIQTSSGDLLLTIK